jgi:protein-disulfide isomerase
LAGGWSAWQQAGYPVEREQASAPRAAAPDGEMSAMGDPQAPVVIEEFTDFQCGYCASHALNTVPRIKEAYVDTGLVYYVVRDFALEFHPNARLAAMAARCAGAQGHYWPMHDLLYERQSEWSGLSQNDASAMFQKLAGSLKIDGSAFEMCVTSGEFEDEIDRDLLAGKQAGVQGTPSFLINGELVVGAYPFETFEEKIEAALKRSD